MNVPNLPRSLLRLLFAQAGLAGIAASFALAQQAPAPSAATLAKYDTNKNGVLDAAELAALDADQRKAVPVETRDSTDRQKPSDEIITLSPFEVVSDTKGYYAANTMSGTRINTKIEDLGSSISVVTKEQMADFAMLDINDIFLYTANTEGTGTYTDFAIDRNGSVYDNVMSNPTIANRVRGIGPANVSLGNFETSNRVPIDPLNSDGVEISRGPNANVFGLGNAAGTVNQVPASANLTRDRAQAGLRADNWDGWRTSLDLNRVLVPGKLAARVNAARQYDGFTRKPSGVTTERFNAMIKFQPFKTTTISGSYSFYGSGGNRPNATPPRDNVSYWINKGRPTWDPVTSQVKINGQVVGTFAGGTGVPDYFNNSFTGSNRFQLFTDQKGIGYWTTGTTTSPTDPNTLAGSSGRLTLMATSPAPIRNNQPLFTTTPVISDQGIYDWSSMNYAAVNRFYDKTQTFNLSLDQVFFNNQRQGLYGQVAWLREDSQRYERNLMGRPGNAGATGFLQIDPNERLLDGSPNPYFLRPFIGQLETLTQRTPLKWDTYRAQLAYRLDLTHEDNALKWLGRHQLTGYNEYKYRVQRRYSFRDVFTDAHSWIPAGSYRANQGNPPSPNVVRGFFRYYVGDAQGANIDYAPTNFAYGSSTFVYGNPTNGFVREPATLGQAATTDQTGGSNNTLNIIKSSGAVLQSNFLRDSLVTTFGLRQDRIYTKFGLPPTITGQTTAPGILADGVTFDYDYLNHWQAAYGTNSGRTKQAGAVVRPFRNLASVNRTADQGTGAQRFFADALRNLSFSFNKSDSFVPASPAQDILRNPLPNPTGTGKDYGFALNLADGKFVLRVNRYENKQVASRGAEATTLTQRVVRLDLQTAADAFPLVTQATNWVRAANPAWTDPQVQTEVARITGLTLDTQQALFAPIPPTASAQDITAKGTEIEMNYNPTRFWTLQASLTEMRSINSNVSKALQQWIDQRLPIWTTIRDTRTNTLWWDTNYGGSQTPSQNFTSNVQTPFSVLQAQDGKSNPQIRRYAAKFTTNFRLGAITENQILKRFNVGGALRWEDKGAIGYYGMQSLPAVITSLDPNHPIYDKAHAYFDAFVGYTTRLFADKVGATFRLNVRNLQEGGRLQAIGAYPDGTPNNYRIVDPRQFILSATFDL